MNVTRNGMHHTLAPLLNLVSKLEVSKGLDNRAYHMIDVAL